MRNRLLKFEYIPLRAKMEYIILLNFIFFYCAYSTMFILVMWFIHKIVFFLEKHGILILSNRLLIIIN